MDTISRHAQPSGSRRPPRVSFATFQEGLDGLAHLAGWPEVRVQADALVMPYSQWKRAGFVAALRFFDLLNPDDRPTSTLVALTDAVDRTEQFHALFKSHFAPVIPLFDSGGTNAHLDEVLTRMGTSNQLLAQSRAFVRKLAAAAGFDISMIRPSRLQEGHLASTADGSNHADDIRMVTVNHIRILHELAARVDDVNAANIFVGKAEYWLRQLHGLPHQDPDSPRS